MAQSLSSRSLGTGHPTVVVSSSPTSLSDTPRRPRRRSSASTTMSTESPTTRSPGGGDMFRFAAMSVISTPAAAGHHHHHSRMRRRWSSQQMAELTRRHSAPLLLSRPSAATATHGWEEHLTSSRGSQHLGLTRQASAAAAAYFGASEARLDGGVFIQRAEPAGPDSLALPPRRDDSDRLLLRRTMPFHNTSYFLCSGCGRSFDTDAALAEHMELAQHGRWHRCAYPGCSEARFPTFQLLRRHHAEAHQGDQHNADGDGVASFELPQLAPLDVEHFEYEVESEGTSSDEDDDTSPLPHHRSRPIGSVNPTREEAIDAARQFLHTTRALVARTPTRSLALPTESGCVCAICLDDDAAASRSRRSSCSDQLALSTCADPLLHSTGEWRSHLDTGRRGGTVSAEISECRSPCSVTRQRSAHDSRNTQSTKSNRCRLLCGHVFHVECIVPWLAGNWSCPVCRAPQRVLQRQRLAGMEPPPPLPPPPPAMRSPRS